MLGTSRTYTAMLLRLTPKAAETGAEQVIWEHGRRNFMLRAAGTLPIVCPATDDSDWAGMAIFDASPEEVDRIMDAADPRYVRLELDVAHYHQGGGDSARAIRKYRDRLLFLHIKDVESPVPAAEGERPRAYRFVELGRGKVDLPAIFKALDEVKFRGWAVVELDSVPDKTRTPKESALISKKYLEEKLRMKL